MRTALVEVCIGRLPTGSARTRPYFSGMLKRSAVQNAGPVAATDERVETLAYGGRVQHRARRRCEDLPAVVAVAQHQLGTAGVAEDDAGPVARHDRSRRAGPSVSISMRAGSSRG